MQLVTRFQAAGLIEAGKFTIEWPPLDAPSDQGKADLLDKLTRAMKQFFEAGGTEPLLDRSELRRVVGFEDKPADDELREDDPTAVPPAGGRGGTSAPPAPALRAA